jgi:hypothetical protein
MPRYADSLLSNGERVILRSRQHWLATVLDGRYPWLLFLASLVVLLLSQNLDGTVRDVAGYLVLAALVVSLAWLGRVYLGWWSQDYLVTNRRVLKVEGIINKRSADSSLEKINDAQLHQNLVGRLLGYGDLDILTASTAAVDDFRMLDKAPRFKRVMLEQKHDVETETSRPPSPPLRAPGHVATSPGHAQAASEPGMAAARHGGSPNMLPMNADDVARALATLAELRERKAITVEEYEQRREDYLSRL